MKFFISYSNQDEDFVNSLTDKFNNNNIEYFKYSKDIEWGQSITGEISKALDDAEYLVAVISLASLKSSWVNFEIGIAYAKNIKILPILTDKSLEIPSYLNNLQCLTHLDDIDKFIKSQNDNEIDKFENNDFKLENISKSWNILQEELINQNEKNWGKIILETEKFLETCKKVDEIEEPNSNVSFLPALQLRYIWEQMKIGIEASEKSSKMEPFSLTGGDKFINAMNQDKQCIKFDEFLTEHTRNSKECINNNQAIVADYCRKSCTGHFIKKYSGLTFNFNVVSMWLNDSMLITRTASNKSKIESSEIVIVKRNDKVNPDSQDFKDKYTFIYSVADDKIFSPSQETPLHYEIHKELGNKVILHVHPENILEEAWMIPHRFSEEKQLDLFRGLEFAVASVKGRQIKLEKLAKDIISLYNGDEIDSIIGTRHGIWIIEDNFNDALDKAKKIEESAGKRKKKDLKILEEVKKEINERLITYSKRPTVIKSNQTHVNEGHL